MVTGTVAVLIPLPNGNATVSAVGLHGTRRRHPETTADAGVISEQLVATMLRRALL